MKIGGQLGMSPVGLIVPLDVLYEVFIEMKQRKENFITLKRGSVVLA